MNIKVLIKYALLFLISIGLSACFETEKEKSEEWAPLVNTPASFSGDSTGSITEEDTADLTGAITVTDPDANQDAIKAQSNSSKTYGSFSTNSAGEWSYKLDNANEAIQALNTGEMLVEDISISSLDGTTHTINITINGLDEPAQTPATFSGDLSASMNSGDTAPATGTVIVTDPDLDEDVIIAQPSSTKTYGSFSIGTDGAWSYLLDNSNPAVQGLKAGESLTDVIGISSADGTTADITITINPAGIIVPTFDVVVLNGTADEFTSNTGDNADAWDMTPNSTVVDNNGATIDSPYRALWHNPDLNAYIDATYCTNEQPGSTSDGNKFAQLGDRGVKISNNCRRLYQVVEVEVGVEYTFTIDSRSEAMGVNTDVFILNNEITTEAGLDANGASDPSVDAYYLIDNDFNSSKSSLTSDTFTTSTFTFIPSTTKVVIYVRALNAIDATTEVFYDNINILTPQDVTPPPVNATFKAAVLNGTADEYTSNTGDNADAWDMTPNSTVVDNNGATIDSPYRAIWHNPDLNAYIDATYCTNEQPGSTSDGNKFAQLGDRGVKISNNCRRLYQELAVEVGVEYTFSIQSRSEAAGVNTEVFILNNAITTEADIDANGAADTSVDAYQLIDNDFNSSKASTTSDTFTTTTFTFKPTTTTAVIYVRALDAIDATTEVFYDNIEIATPGF